MKTTRWLILFFMLVLASTTLSFVGIDWPYQLLSQQDIDLEENQDHPALSRPLDDPNPFESYNQWSCFPMPQDISVDCVKYCRKDCASETDKDFYVPSISFTYNQEFYSFDPGYELLGDYKCEDVAADLKSRLEEEPAICLYGAQLQENPVYPDDPFKRWSVWVLDQLKTNKGSWVVHEYEKTSIEDDEAAEESEESFVQKSELDQ